MIEPGRPRARRGVGRQGLARRCGTCCASSATTPTASTSGSASASTPTRPARTPATFATTHGVDAARGRPARRLRLRRPRRLARREARAVLGVRAVEAPPVQRGRARRTATTCSRPATTSTTKPRCCSATCCAGRPAYLGRQHPVLPAAPGFARKVKPLVRLGERETRRVLRAHRHRLHRRGVPDGRGQPAPRLQGGAERARGALTRHEGRVPVRLLRARPRPVRRRRGRGARRPRARAASAARRRPATSARSAGCRPAPPAVALPMLGEPEPAP